LVVSNRFIVRQPGCARGGQFPPPLCIFRSGSRKPLRLRLLALPGLLFRGAPRAYSGGLDRSVKRMAGL
jgi:hypothetical protein